MSPPRLVAVALLLSTGLATAATPQVSPDPATLRVTPDDAARARKLVRRLGSDLFRERDDATRELAGMGRKALAALQEARGDADPEVAARVRHLLPPARADDLQARVDSFLADAPGRYEHDVPGWGHFRAALGDGPLTRELFSELVRDRANLELLGSLAGGPAELTPGLTALAGGPAALRVETGPADELRRAADDYRTFLFLSMRPRASNRADGTASVRPPSPAEFALLLLAETVVPDDEAVGIGAQFNSSQLFYQQFVREWFAGKNKYSPALKPLAELWLDSRPNPALGVRVGRSLALDSATLARYAARALAKPSRLPHDSTNAITALLQTGDVKSLPALVKAFGDDRTVLAQAAAGGFDIRVRDYALVAALHLTGQNPLDYGFETNTPTRLPTVPSYMTYYLKRDAKTTADAKSRAAFGKWRDYQATQLGAALGAALGDRAATVRNPVHAAKPDPKVIKDPDDD
jgi:hypothetical protein